MEGRPIAEAVMLTLVLAGCGKTEISADLVSMFSAKDAPRQVVEIIHTIDAGDISKLRALLESGAVPTPAGSALSPIHAAITHFRDGQLVCDSSALELLLAHGADPDFVDQDSGFTPLEDALAMGDIRCANLLKEAGADVYKRGRSGRSVLQAAVKGAGRTDSTEIIRLVLSWGVDPNILSAGRVNTALHLAAWPAPGVNAAPIVAELLQHGADPCISDSAGDTPLDLATYLNQSNSVRALLMEAMRKCPRR